MSRVREWAWRNFIFVELNKILKTDFNQNGITKRFDQSIKIEEEKWEEKKKRTHTMSQRGK